MADFFTKQWADAVRDALTAGPDEQARAVKLQEYWDFFDFLKSMYPASWALGCRDLGSYLFVQWAGGTVTDCRIIGPDDPLQATYVLGMDYRDWKALHDGYDAQRTVMYRKIMLEQGDLLEFFKAIYFFVESLAVIGAVPAGYPDRVDGTFVRLEPDQRHIDPVRPGTQPWGQAAARMPRAALSEAMIAPPTVTARKERAKLVWKNLCRSQARVSSSVATTAIAAMIAAP